MTTANVTAAGMKTNVQASAGIVNVQKKAEEAASVFGAMMNQYSSAGFQSTSVWQDGTKEQQDVSGSLGYVDKMPAADRGMVLTEAGEQPVTASIDSAEEDLNVFEEAAVAAVGEAAGVTEEEVRDALDALGMTVFDLLNAQNLGMLMMQLTGMDDSTQLLMNSDFQNLMNNIGQLGSELMGSLNLGMDQMDKLISRIDEFMEQEISVLPAADMNDAGEMQTAIADAQAADISAIKGQTAFQDETGPAKQAEAAGQADAEEFAGEPQLIAGKESETEASRSGYRENAENGQSSDLERQIFPERELAEQEDFSQQPAGQREFVLQERTDESPVGAPGPVDIPLAEQPAEVMPPASSYTSVDSVELIHQIVEQIQSAVRGDTASLEMQLNPEHLGRLYVNLTSRAGTVNAQFIATNEAVRAELEAQLADLRENLSQAGVKVDAIEITVSSHQLEENLEQGARQEEQQAADQEGNQRGRRNIILSELDELDELSGVLTEEEFLAAQIMKDNGNSMDVTA